MRSNLCACRMLQSEDKLDKGNAISASEENGSAQKKEAEDVKPTDMDKVDDECNKGDCDAALQDGTTSIAEENGGDQKSEAEAIKQKELDKGKDEYNKGNYAEALKAWSRSMMSVKYILDKGLYSHNKAQLQEVHDMELRLNVNMAQAYLKTGEWSNAVTYADKALVRDPDSTKALYRKASALMQLLSFVEAAAVLERLLEVEPESAAAKAMLAEARRNEELSTRRARRMSRRMFSQEGGPSRGPLGAWRAWLWLQATRSSIFTAAGQMLQAARHLPQRCRHRASLAVVNAWRRWQTFAQRARQKLQSMALFQSGPSKGDKQQ